MAGSSTSVEFRILGPFEVLHRGAPIQVGTQMECALIADLVLHANDVVSVDRLAEDLWDGDPPRRALQSLRVYVSHVRKALRDVDADAILETRAPGYRLNIPADAIDATRFERMLTRGHEALGAALYEEASSTLREAEGLFRGRVLADMSHRSFAAASITRLEEQRLVALEARIEADLMLGRYAELVAELEEITGSFPLRENLWALRMRALYRAGRQADALAAYRQLRQRLSDELGIDPSPDLQRLEQAVLQQDPSLTPFTESTEAVDLPSGVVTFISVDVVGAAKLWDADAEAMGRAMRRYDQITAEQISSQGGFLLADRGVGEARLAVFARASDAVAAAAALQIALTQEAWPSPEPVTARIGVATGEATLHEGEYRGRLPERCARLRELGHGGQVLVAQTTVDLVGGGVSGEISLGRQGAFQLGTGQAQDVFQLAHPELPGEFPPLRGAETGIGNLPAQLTTFVGRRQEREHLGGQLAAHRLVSLIGPGGVGKTRLAVEVARDADAGGDGVWFVDLSSLTDAGLVAQTTAVALGLREQPGRGYLDLLTEHLRDKTLLLVLDNCEHLLAACAQLLASLLAACPQLRALATSRQPLGVPGEIIFTVPPLDIPGEQTPATVEGLAAYESVRLFCDRAAAGRGGMFRLTLHDVPAVARICTLVDGIPLAIELAAARIRSLSPQDIAARLGDHLRFLGGDQHGRPERHQTLAAAIAWSHELLTQDERALLRRLAVFAGGCTPEAAATICAPDQEPEHVEQLLGRLADRSLLVAEQRDDQTRYRMLETIRTYAVEQLDASGETHTYRDAHAAWCEQLAEQFERALDKPDEARWFATLEDEHDNLRAFLEHTAPQNRLTAATRLHRFWAVRGFLSEGRSRLERALEHETSPLTRARGLGALVHVLHAQGENAAARPVAEESLEIARELGDAAAAVSALSQLGAVIENLGDLDQAETIQREVQRLQEDSGNKVGVAIALVNLGSIALSKRDRVTARHRLNEALRLARETGAEQVEGATLQNLIALSIQEEDTAQARTLLQQALPFHRKRGDRGKIAPVLMHLGIVAYLEADYPTARRYYEEAKGLWGELGYRRGVAAVLLNLAAVSAAEGEYDDARATFAEALRLAHEVSRPGAIAGSIDGIAECEAERGHVREACVLLGAVDSFRSASGFARLDKEQIAREEFEARCRETLGDQACDAALAEGHALSLDEAIERALIAAERSDG